MGLTMEMRKGFAREKAKRYRQGSKKKKGQLIEEYMEMAGCTRHHAAWMLRTDGAGTPNGVAIPARCPVVGPAGLLPGGLVATTSTAAAFNRRR